MSEQGWSDETFKTMWAAWLAFVAPMAEPKDGEHTGGAHDARIAELQREAIDLHIQLWQRQSQRVPGDVAPAPVIEPAPGDMRFVASDWIDSPWHDYLRQAYLINADFLQRAAEALPAENDAERRRLRFMTRQYVDALAPSNFAATNPEVIRLAVESRGESLARGIINMLVDLDKGRISMSDESAFRIGGNIAVTPGAVVFENAAMQLIQYAPTTERVAARPLLIVPPCINRYYILDLQAENSFVRHAVARGQTVFLISWRNPHQGEADFTWDGLAAQPIYAWRIAAEICGTEQVNALGFCLGGTLLATSLAAARARGEDPVHALTLLTTPLDFAEAGELACFVDEAGVAAREASIGKGGLMYGAELAAAFSSLRANELVWHYVVGNYLKGNTPPAFDLLFWNADSTNLPGPFATWYLRHLYLENKLCEPDALTVLDTPIDLRRIDVPTFVYASREDHIVPWKSAYATRGRIDGESVFVLGASGHVAGVINPPAQKRRSHWRVAQGGAGLDADAWQAQAVESRGSWWPVLSKWLAQYGGGSVAARTTPGNENYPVIEAAPGRYVKQ